MNTKILYSTVLAFTFSLLLASCSSLQKGEFASRKYYNFPLTKHSSENAQKEQAAVIPIHKKETEKTTVSKVVSLTENTTTASASKKPVFVAYKETKPVYSNTQKKKSISDSKIKNEPVVVSCKRTGISKIARKETAHPASNSDGMVIVELILAIILPPLAVVIHSGKFKKWFWITLLLCVAGGLFGGLSYISILALCWVAAIVSALCYVFGIIKD